MATKTVVISPEVRDLLARSTIEGPVLKLPPGQLDRKLYEATDKALRGMGGKWTKRLGGHLFGRLDFRQIIESAIKGDEIVDRKKTLEQFWTPPDLARRMCDIAEIEDGDLVLEPSAGDGGIALEAHSRGALVVAVEIDQQLVAQLCSETEGRMRIYQADFTKWPETGLDPDHRRDGLCNTQLFDKVVMNPPFSRNQDVIHVRRAYRFLKPWGILVSVMSPHWRFAREKMAADFRADLGAMDKRAIREPWAWEALPEGSFKQAGTNVNAGLLTLRKPG